jgi:GNAT superfamily N-acetyltransferase
MIIEEVKHRHQWRLFHQAAHYIYARDPHWIAPLESDLEKIFSPAANKIFQYGEAACWVLLNEHRRPMGRIAAFYDNRNWERTGIRSGGVGFFECVRQPAAGRLLLQTAERWLRQRDIQAIDGPINFGDRDKFWGLLQRGWQAPIYLETYNPPYYHDFFRAQGYEPQEQVFTFSGKLSDIPADRNHRVAKLVRQRYGVQSRLFRLRALEQEAAHIATVYNAAFRDKSYFKPIPVEQVKALLQQLKPVIDPHLFCLAFAEDQPVGFCALMPEINPWLKFAQGRLPWWKLPRFAWQQRFRQPRDVKGVAFAIHPDYQHRGVFAELVDFLYHNDDRYNPRIYERLHLATIRGNNLPMVQSVGGALGVKIDRIHLAYRKRLDTDLPHEPLDFYPADDTPLGQVPDPGLYPTA